VIASRLKQALLGAFLALLGLSAGYLVGRHVGKTAGIVEGLTDYHNMCYNNGPGFIIIDKRTVVCSPAGKLSDAEWRVLDKM